MVYMSKLGSSVADDWMMTRKKQQVGLSGTHAAGQYDAPTCKLKDIGPPTFANNLPAVDSSDPQAVTRCDNVAVHAAESPRHEQTLRQQRLDGCRTSCAKCVGRLSL
jgi:hypothetical protein